jgi:hypothetical protein
LWITGYGGGAYHSSLWFSLFTYLVPVVMLRARA